jgi:hypothetical protein
LPLQRQWDEVKKSRAARAETMCEWRAGAEAEVVEVEVDSGSVNTATADDADDADVSVLDTPLSDPSEAMPDKPVIGLANRSVKACSRCRWEMAGGDREGPREEE